MNHQNNSPFLLGDALLDIIRQAVREEVQAAIKATHEEDRLLEAEEAARLLSVSVDWVYRHGKSLPFTRKIGPKMLRFSSLGIQKYLAIRNIA